ncbi:MAG: hypothetical protein F6J95_014160 [Leptolyngbya sp. SIO1E4]|nr:hypothetical protein [Leptolyngbya sp. SIO1E4]
MKRIRSKGSNNQNFQDPPTIRSAFTGGVLWKLSLFIGTLFVVILSHLGIFHLPASAAPNPDIAILNTFVPNNAPPGVPVVYRLTFRSITGNPVGITSLSHTLPSTPGSLVFDGTATSANTCGSSVTITEGSNPGSPGSFTLTGGTIPAGDPGQCVIEIPVKGFEEGNHTDTIPAEALFTDVGENQDATSATLQVDESQNVNISKRFSPNTIPGNGRSEVRIRLRNQNDYDLTGTTDVPTLVDDLPSTPNQLTVDTRTGAPAPTTTCAGGTVNITNGGTSIELVGGTIPANSRCDIFFPVTQANGGTYTNNIPPNSLSTVNQISNGNNVNANLNIQTEVTIDKSFSDNLISEGDNTTVTITVRNGSAALTNAGLTDDLPAPLVVASPANATTTCTVSGNSEPLSVTPGSSSFSLTAGQIPSSDPNTNGLGECVIVVEVTADPGIQTNIPGQNSSDLDNIIPAMALTNTQNQTNEDPTNDTIRVQTALVASKSYSNNNTISPGASTQMDIQITNRSVTTNATGVNFTDALPSPLEVANPLEVSYNSNCGGGVLSAVAPGDTTLNFTGGNIPANSTCTIRIAVFVPATATVGDNLDNVIDDDSINNDQGFDSNGVTGDEGRLQVVNRVEIIKAFDRNAIRRGEISTLIIRIENNRRNSTTGDPEPLTGVAINDNLPDNLQVATPANFSHTGCSHNGATPVFSGTTSGSTAFSMTGAAIAPISDSDPEADTCEIRFDVAEINLDFFFDSPNNETPRTYNNTTSGFTNDQSEPADEDTADLTVISPLDGEKFFQSEQVTAGGRSTAVIQLNNSLPTPLTVVSFTDSWTQANTVVADPINASTTCGGGSVTTTPGSQTVTLTSGTVPAQTGGVFGLCEIRFDVQMDASGGNTFTNTLPANSVSTNEGFTNPTDITGDLTRTTATINVNKAFSPNSLFVGDPATVTITVTNPNNGIPITEFGFTDTMPAEMLVFSIPNATTTCTNGTVTANAGENTYTLSGADLGSDESCEVSVQVTLVDTGNSINEVPIGTIESKENVTNDQLAQSTLNALAALRPAKSFNPTSIEGAEISQLTLTIENLQVDTSSGESLQNVSITDTLPADLFIANTPNASTDCAGGTVNAPAGGTVVSMTGATLAPQASCQIFVDVTSALAGSYENQIDRGNVTAQLQPSLGGSTIENTSRPTATLTVTSDSLPPEILLVKRITAINGVDITGDEDSPGSDDPHWPTPTATSLRGVINYTDPVVPGDDIEYTIYYLNTGLSNATDVRICDRIPEFTTFVPRGYSSGTPAADPSGLPGADRGIVLAEAGSEASLSNVSDGDAGYYFAPGEDPQTAFPGISCDGDSSNGTVVVSVPNPVPPATGPSTPPASYGYIRFKSRVN